MPASLLAQQDPDALYRTRTTLADARSAAAIWDARCKANPQDFESCWKLARVMYWLGGHEGTEQSRRSALERGTAVARQAVTMQPNKPEGYFWMAANMGALAESFGLRQGLKYRGQIKDALEKVLQIDPGFQQGSADRVLGRWYHLVPGLFGGSEKKSEEHLRKSLTYGPDNTVSHYFLAETLFDLNRDKDAIEELKKVIAAPFDAEWEPENKEYRERAKKRLTQVDK